MVNVKDIVTDKTKPVVTISCSKTFWRKRWRYYLVHGDGRILNISKQTYATIKEMMRDIAVVRGKNAWPIDVAQSRTRTADLLELAREIAGPEFPPKK